MKRILIELDVLGFCRSFYKTEKYARVERTTESLDIKYKFHRAKYLRETSSLIRWGGGRTGPLDMSLNSYLHSPFTLKEMKNSSRGLQEVPEVVFLPLHLYISSLKERGQELLTSGSQQLEQILCWSCVVSMR